MTIEELNDLTQNKEFVLLDFFATWCMPCKMQSEIIDALKEKNHPNLKIIKIDVDIDEDLTNSFKISSVPTLVMFKNGEQIQRVSGIASVDGIESWME